LTVTRFDALPGAIRQYGGGIVFISHNHEFTNNIGSERWVVKTDKVSLSY
jgi:ATPase subunit of ABC transporter with duplicated ATPase domains